MDLSSEKVLCGVYQNSSDPYFIISSEGIVLWANDTAVKSNPTFQNNLSLGFLHLIDSNRLPDLSVKSEKVFECMGLNHPCKFHLVPIPESDCFLAHQIPTSSFYEKIPQAQQLMQQNRQMVHQIYSNLSPLMSLAVDKGSQRHKELLQFIGSNCLQLLNMFDHLTKYISLLNDDHNINLEPIAVHDFVRHVVDDARSVLRNVPVSIELTCDGEEIITMASTRLLAMAIAQLMDNAITHNNKEDKAISIHVTKTSSDAVITVCDNGKLISPAVEADLFKPFSGSFVEESQPFRLGLGLTLCSMIAKAHGGRLLYLRKGESNCFSISIPIRAVSPSLHSELFYSNTIYSIVQQELVAYAEVSID